MLWCGMQHVLRCWPLLACIVEMRGWGSGQTSREEKENEVYGQLNASHVFIPVVQQELKCTSRYMYFTYMYTSTGMETLTLD